MFEAPLLPLLSVLVIPNFVQVHIQTIDAFVNGLRSGLSIDIDVLDYAEHAMGSGADATAVAYVESTTPAGEIRWGVGSDPNIITASLRAVLAAAERQQA